MFSVILPVYNGDRWLGEAIQSVMNQTYKDFECWIICNGCTDNSVHVATQLTESDSRFTVLNTPHANKSNALNIGILYSGRAWIAPIDADDIWLPQKLELQALFIEQHPAVDIIGTQLDYIGALICEAPRNPLGHEAIYECFSRGKNPIPFPSSVYKKDIHIRGVGFFNTSNFIVEDYDFWQRCKTHNMIMVNLPHILLHYRLHGDPRTSTVDGLSHEAGGIEKGTIRTKSIVEARQQLAKAMVDSMYVSCDVEKMPEHWGIIGQIRKFDEKYRKGSGPSTPVNSVDNSKVGKNED